MRKFIKKNRRTVGTAVNHKPSRKFPFTFAHTYMIVCPRGGSLLNLDNSSFSLIFLGCVGIFFFFGGLWGGGMDRAANNNLSLDNKAMDGVVVVTRSYCIYIHHCTSEVVNL